MRKGWQDQGVGTEGSVQTENIMYRESLRWQESRCAGGTERSAWLERVEREEGEKRPWKRRVDIQEFDIQVVSEQGCSLAGRKGRH